MLYREGKRLTKEDLQDHIEILKQTFPSFFRKQGALPIFYNYAKHRMRVVDLFTPGGDMKVGNRVIPPTPKGIKSIGHDMEDGFNVEVIFSKSAPNYSNGDYKFNNLNFQLAHNSKLEPSTDLELLIFLWFYCPEFNNNDCAYKKDNADFTFVIPADDVESKWDNISARRKFEDELLIEGTRVSFDVVKAVMSKMGIAFRNEEKVDRITLFDIVSGSKASQEKYYSIKRSIAPEAEVVVSKPKASEAAPKTVEAVVETTSLKNRVVALIEATKIYNDGTDWKIKTGGKPKAICKVAGTGEDEEIFNLIEFVTSNLEAQEAIEKYSK
jgi:hypothetical protein